jgi:hypothetical protein
MAQLAAGSTGSKMTQSGHERLKIAALRNGPEPYFANGKSLL